MFKLLLVASALAVVIAVQNFTPKKIEAIKPVETTFVGKPIALVKYKDMIYHCQGVIKTKCGHSIHCGPMSVHCVTDIQVEYISWQKRLWSCRRINQARLYVALENY